MGYENDPYRDETAYHQCTLMRISNQIGRKVKQHLLDFGGNYGGDEDNKAGWVNERWKEEHRERRPVEKKHRMEKGAGDSEAEEREDKEEINELFKIGKEKKITQRSAVELNQLGKPAINKLKKLSHLTNVLSRKQLQYGHGVLSLLKNWLEPLPDGSLPNIHVCAAILKILDDLPVDLKQRDQRDQLKRSGLGKVVMLLSKSDEETAASRKLAKELADKWGLEDRKVVDEERISKRPPVKKVATEGVGMSSPDDQLVSAKYSQGLKSGEPSSSQHASRPKPVSIDFVVRPPSKVDPGIQAKQMARHQPHAKAEEGEEDEEINELFRIFSKNWKNGSRAAKIAFDVEKVMAELELAAEDDAHLNWLGKPAVNKLKKLSHLTNVLAKKQLHHEFLDHGVLSLLKNWLEPLPDGSLPNINVRAAILKILDDLPVDLKQRDQREQLKRSGLGKVVMLLSKSDEETAANRKLAKELADKWGLEDRKVVDEERISKRPPVKKVATEGVGMSSPDDQLVSAKYSQGSKSGEPSSNQHASRPKPVSMDFVVRPPSKVDPVAARIRAKQMAQHQPHAKKTTST